MANKTRRLAYMPTTIKLDGEKFIAYQMEQAAKSKEAWGDLQLLSAQMIGFDEEDMQSFGLVIVYHSPTINRNFALPMSFKLRYLDEIGCLVYPEGY